MTASSGGYQKNWEKLFLDTLGESLEAASNVKCMMMLAGFTPQYSTHEFVNAVTSEVSGTAYTAEGTTCAGNAIAWSTPNLSFDVTDPVWNSSYITNAAQAAYYTEVGATSADQLHVNQDFGGAFTSTNGDFTIQEPGAGIWTIDLVI